MTKGTLHVNEKLYSYIYNLCNLTELLALKLMQHFKTFDLARRYTLIFEIAVELTNKLRPATKLLRRSQNPSDHWCPWWQPSPYLLKVWFNYAKLLNHAQNKALLYTRYPIVARALGRVRRASKGILHTRSFVVPTGSLD